MEQTLWERELRYQTMISVSRRMLSGGTITRRDLARIEDHLYKKYRPIHRAELTC